MKGKYYKSLTDITMPAEQSYCPNIGKKPQTVVSEPIARFFTFQSVLTF
jgi:hypothetical protein